MAENRVSEYVEHVMSVVSQGERVDDRIEPDDDESGREGKTDVCCHTKIFPEQLWEEGKREQLD